MTISYISSYFALGQSTDAKPLDVPVGFELLEIDSGRIKYWSGTEWKNIEGGTTGTWNPFQVEEIRNKTLTLNLNTVRTSSGTLGLFGFGNTGTFNFIPIGSSNLYLKVNSAGTGFEFADPATTGSWDPDAAETITNKTIVAENNIIKSATPAAGKILLDNGTKYTPLAKGSIGQALKVKSDGTVGWDTDATGGGGGGEASMLPSRVGYYEGYWHGGITTTAYDAQLINTYGILADECAITKYSTDTITEGFSFTRGKYANFPISTASSYGQFQTNYLFCRDWSSYFLCKFRFSSTTSMNGLFGFIETKPAQYSTATVFNNYDALAFGKVTTYTNFQIYNNAATATATRTDTGVAFDTNPHTIELFFDAPNNRTGWRLHGSTFDPEAAWNYLSSNIARTGYTLAAFASINGTTTGTNNLELYDLEVRNKVMF